MAVSVNDFLAGIGFHSKTVWYASEDGVVSDFPVRVLVDFLRDNGMMYIGARWVGKKIVHTYKWGNDFIVVTEFPGSRVTKLVLEFGDFVFVEDVFN